MSKSYYRSKTHSAPAPRPGGTLALAPSSSPAPAIASPFGELAQLARGVAGLQEARDHSWLTPAHAQYPRSDSVAV